MRTARETSKTKTLQKKARLFVPILPVDSQELFLKVPKRGQFHAAIRVTTKHRDSCQHQGDRQYRV